MANLYPHKVHGWQIVFCLYFPDGSSKKKYKIFRVKDNAILALQDIEKLEVYSAKQQLTREEITYFLHKKYLSREEAERISPEPVCTISPKEITWDKLKKVYERHVTKVGQDMTRATHPYRANRVLAYFRDLRNFHPLAVNDKEINDFIFYCREKNLARDTINKYLTVLRVMFDYLVSEKAIKDNPARKVRYFRNPTENIPRILYPDEFKSFLEGLKKYSHLCRGYFAEMLLVYIYTGLRRYELIFLKGENINFAHGLIKIVGKGSKERLIEIHPSLLPVLQSVMQKNSKRHGQYFFGGYREPLVLYDEVSKAFKKFRTGVRLPAGVKLHSLRHTFISYLLASGADLEYVRQIAGHESIRTTQKYIHLIPRKEQQILHLDYSKFIDKKSAGK
jgi:site-specific recombinase XerD